MNDIKAEVKAILAAEKFCEIFDNPKDFDRLNAMSLEDLAELYKMVVEVMKRKRDKKGTDIKFQLSIGDLVYINSAKAKGEIYEVVKLNPKKAVVKNSDGVSYDCPYSLIKLS
jgi:hypothetical protein